MSNNLGKTIINSIAWSAIERFSVQGIQFILTIIISRLVSPEDYGLIAMLSIFIAIAQSFVDSGFSNAIIQKQNRTDVDISTVFVFNIIVSLIFYAVLYLVSPYIASFYNKPILKDLCRFVSLSVIISSFSIVQQAINVINHDFKIQAKASLVAVIISGIIGIILAKNGYGVWALAIQSLTNQLIISIIIWIISKWKISIAFSWTSFNSLFSFGSKLLVSGLLHTIYSNMYTLIIGKVYSPVEVGFYNQANTFSNFFSVNVTNILSRAMYPIQCEMQDDVVKLKKLLLKYIRSTLFIIFPLLIGLFVLAKPFISCLLTEKWLPATNILMILCIANLFYPLMVINNSILNVKGRSDLFLKAEVIKKAVAVLILFLSLKYGLQGLCFGIVIYNFIDVLIIMHYVNKVIDIGYLEELRSIFPILLASMLMGMIVFIITLIIKIDILKIAISIVVGVLSYISLCKMCKVEELSDVSKYLRNLVNMTKR